MSTIAPQLLAQLSDQATPLSSLIKALGDAEHALVDAPEIVIGLSANVTMDLLGTYLRREALLAGVRARIVLGNFDDPIGDIERFRAEKVDRVVIIPFFDNFLPAFEVQLASLSPDEVAAKELELQARYALALQQAGCFTSVQLGLCHRFGQSSLHDGRDVVSMTIDRFNTMLRQEARKHANVQLMDVSLAIAEIGRAAAFDQRFYLRYKAPYSTALLALLAKRLSLSTRAFGTRFLKVLALDCDNTLWGGVIGEDLIDGIKLDPFDYPGNVYWRAQQVIGALEKRGIVLCLCTKNNPDDVTEVLEHHPNMVIKPEQIAARRVNWQDKVSNLISLAEELNLGLDSFVFLDDSPVEIESVRVRLPEVTSLQVPTALSEYSALMEQIEKLFLAAGWNGAEASKTEQYRLRAATNEAQSAFASHEDYLASLELEAALHLNSYPEATRIAELSQKSNQFNLTTRRYTQGEIEAMMAAEDADVFSITVRNRFGNAGLTGVIVLKYTEEGAVIENFLMSCRVLGQGVEFAIWKTVAGHLDAHGATSVHARFLASAKNAQVSDFYDRLGLTLVDDSSTTKRYSQAIGGISPPASPWVKVSNG